MDVSYSSHPVIPEFDGAGLRIWNVFRTPDEIRERLIEIAGRAQALADNAASENRPVSAEEAEEIDALHNESQSLNLELTRREKIDSLTAFAARTGGRKTTAEGPAGRGGRSDVGFVIGKGMDGEPIRAYRHKESLAQAEASRLALPHSVRIEDISPGRWIVGQLTSNWHGADLEQELQIKNAMSGGNDPSGGFLMPEPIALRTLDLARALARVLQAGAVTVPIEGPAFWAKVSKDPTLQWRPENVALTSSDMNFTRVNVNPRTVGGLVTISEELLEDAPNAAQVIETALIESLAREIDRVALYGDGSSEPAGLTSSVWSAVQSVTSVGALTDYAELISAQQKIMEKNGPDPSALAAIMSPRDYFKYAGLTDQTDQPLRKPDTVALMPFYATTQVRTTEGGGGAESSIYVGDWSQLVFAIRRLITISVDNGGLAFDAIQVKIRAHLRADIALLRDEFFVKLTGVTA